MNIVPSTTRQRHFRIAVRQYPPFETAIQLQWSDFEAQARTGLVLELVSLDLHLLEHALFGSGGMVRGEWDIAFVNTDWVAAMHQLGAAADLAPLLANDPPPDWPSGWTPSLMRHQTIGQAVLGIPYHDGPECLIFRKDLFTDPALRREFESKFGRPLEPPRTWADFHLLARFFHAPEKKLYGTAFAAFPDGHNSVYDFLLQLWTRGGELLGPDGHLQFETPEAEAALSFYRGILTDASAVHPDCKEMDSVRAGMSFAAGELALAINWFGFAARAHTAEDSAVRGCVDIAPLPCDPAARSVSLNVYWLLSLASGSVHREIAWKFLRHLMTPAMDRLTTLSGAIGCRKSTWLDREMNQSIPFYRRMEELHNAAREIPQRSDWPAIARTIDTLVARTVKTSVPIWTLLREAQQAHV